MLDLDPNGSILYTTLQTNTTNQKFPPARAVEGWAGS